MHVGIFAERFVGRYGADRVLVILAELLERYGHRVTLVGVRFSAPVLERFAGRTVRVPDFAGRAPEERTLRYLEDTRYYRERHLPRFDACVVGSYPFISSIPYLAEQARQVVFLDFGVVPTYGYPPQVAGLIEQVRANRRKHLRHCAHIVAISRFIADDQARPDCADQVPVSVVLLGADHLVSQLGTTERDERTQEQQAQEKSYTQLTLERLRARQKRLVLVLGRWEPGCYKNSQAAFAVARTLAEVEPDVALLVPAHPHYFGAEPDVADNVFCIGLPTDAEMLAVTHAVEAGISLSLWEGFNLPIVEMQYLEKRAYAFRLAAHPEVVVSPDQLCADPGDMAEKLYGALQAGGRPEWAASAGLAAWREKFSWQRFGREFARILERAA